MSSKPLNIAVVGRGLIGSAAARHLSKTDHRVTLIGPEEPEDKSTHDGVFGSHYDEGRITRLLDPHPVWEDVAAASITRYGEIARQSGIEFFTEAGLLIGGKEGGAYLNSVRAVKAQNQISAHELSGAGLAKTFPFLSFSDDMTMLHQPRQAGHISPRRLVQAQTKCATANGATLVPEVVRAVAGHTVVTARESLTFDRILIACGAFTNSISPVQLDLTAYARTIALYGLDQVEADRLSAMPSIIYKAKGNEAPYILPPIRYPDGQIYLKIGGDPDDIEISEADAMQAWFRTDGQTELIPYFTEMISALIPKLAYQFVTTRSCMVTYTQTGLPYIGEIAGDVFVATGGCGGAAKSSDELGRIAAQTVLGVPDNRFEIKLKGTNAS